MIQIKILKTKNIETPKKATVGSAAFDLVNAGDETTLSPGERANFNSGFKMEIPYGYFGLIRPRSGLATKRGLDICTSGVIDSDYRGEISVNLINHSNEIQVIKSLERIAQMIILPIPEIIIVEVKELSETDRGAGGFGSSDKINAK